AATRRGARAGPRSRSCSEFCAQRGELRAQRGHLALEPVQPLVAARRRRDDEGRGGGGRRRLEVLGLVGERVPEALLLLAWAASELDDQFTVDQPGEDLIE